MINLQSLLQSLPTKTFWQDYWTQRAFHLEALNRTRFQPLFSWADLNYLLNYQQLTSPTIRFSKDGESLANSTDPRRWRELLQQGATLIINELHWRVPTVAEMSSHLQDEFGARTQVNLYCSPAQQQGFDCHYDTHDVLILQVDGVKEWFVFPETTPFPTSKSRSKDDLPPTGDPYLHCVLQPGDILYIPRGHWHYAVAQDCISLHLTVGIHANTGIDWLTWIAKELQEQPEWRESLPPFDPRDPTSLAHLRSRLSELGQRLVTYVQDPDLAKKFAEDLWRRDQPALLLDLPTQVGESIFTEGLLSRFIWSPLHRLRVKHLEAEHFQVIMGGKQVEIKGIPEPFMDRLCEADEFSVFEMADWDPSLDIDGDIVPLLTQLVQAGILMLKSSQDVIL